jgi:hypothetical protein
MPVNIFLSTVSDEFRRYRDLLRSDLTRHNVEVKVQEDLKDFGGETLDKLDVYIAHCDAVVHLTGNMTGSYPGERGLSAPLAKYPDLPTKLPPLSAALKDGVGVSYTQWEAWLALYHGKLLLIANAPDTSEREPQYAPTDDSRTSQDAHLARLRVVQRYPGCTFTVAETAWPEERVRQVRSNRDEAMVEIARRRATKKRAAKSRNLSGIALKARVFETSGPDRALAQVEATVSCRNVALSESMTTR